MKKQTLNEQISRIKEIIREYKEDSNNIPDDIDIPGFEIDEQVGPNTQTPKVNDRIGNIVNIMNSLTPKTVQVIKSNNPKLNGMSWGEYVRTYKITMQEIAQANQIRNAAKTKPKSPQVKPVISGTTTQTQVNPVVSGSTSQTTPIGTST